MIDQYHICTNIDQCLIDLGDNDRLAIATSLKHAVNNRLIPNWKISCFSNNRATIQSYFISMFVRRNHRLSHEINKFLNMAAEGGLFVKWNQLSSQLNDNPNLHRYQGDFRSGTLLFWYIYPALFVYMGTNLFAIFIFILEHCVHYRANRPNASRLVRFGDLLIDGQRHFFIRITLNNHRRLLLRKRYKTSLESKQTPKFRRLRK